MNNIALKPRTARELGIMCGFPPPPEKRPDLTNWDLAPFNRWSFMNVRKLFPTVEVKADSAYVSQLPDSPLDLSSLRFSDHADKPISLPQFLDRSYTDGLLVLHKGAVISETYGNNMQADTPHLAQSISKSIVGALTGILHQQGLIDPQAPLVEYVPELKHCGYQKVTLSQALDMTSGVRFVEDYNHPESDIRRIDIASGWRPSPDSDSCPTIRDVILTLPQIRPHGERFEYRSIETDVVAWALERAANESLANLVSELIWQKIGAEHDAFFTVDRAMTALADGGFNATLRDYARFGLMMQNGGRTESIQVVPEDWVEQSTCGNGSVYDAPYSDLCPSGSYRNFWWLNNIRQGDFMARGVFGQMIYVDRDSELTIVKLSTWPDYLIRHFARDSLLAFDAIRKHLL
jgi:CubicO group peptidase (beta-lactamase class C family)